MQGTYLHDNLVVLVRNQRRLLVVARVDVVVHYLHRLAEALQCVLVQIGHRNAGSEL